jgi:hypothetical protein
MTISKNKGEGLDREFVLEDVNILQGDSDDVAGRLRPHVEFGHCGLDKNRVMPYHRVCLLEHGYVISILLTSIRIQPASSSAHLQRGLVQSYSLNM